MTFPRTESQKSSYRQIIKATSIFGGLQIFNILIIIIRSKFVAVLLGPTGMGIAGLLTATIGIVSGLTNFGLGTSAVKDISAAHGTGNNFRISIVVTVFRRLVWITGILGSLATLGLSHWLSQITFGSKDYTFSFILISITLFLNQVSSGQSVLLRGMRQIKYLAKSSLAGSILGLATTVPLYYFFGLNGIVPGIIVTSVTSVLLTWYYAKKIKIVPIFVSRIRTIAEGKGMLKMGFMISMSGLITMGVSYFVRIFISNTGGLGEVGLYNAGFAIINTYVGVIFTAMSTDYYPRLSLVAYSDELSKTAINQQAEIAVLILAPFIMIFMVLINWIVILLYSRKFLPVNEMIIYAALGMFFKAASWSIAFVLLSKGANKLYFWNELTANIYLLVLNMVGYHSWGLTGLGISFLVFYIIYLIQVYFISMIKFGFSFTQGFIKIFISQFILAFLCFILAIMHSGILVYLIGSVLIVISTWQSYKELDKRLELKSALVIIRNRLLGK